MNKEKKDVLGLLYGVLLSLTITLIVGCMPDASTKGVSKVLAKEQTRTEKILEASAKREERRQEELLNAPPAIYPHEATATEIAEEEYYDSLETVARIVQAEAGNQGLMGKKLVAAVIFNRMESGRFPDTPIGVLTQKNQFSTMTDGALEKQQVPDEETYQAVMEELYNRTDDRIFFFTAGRYNGSGKPAYRHGNHYFSYL